MQELLDLALEDPATGRDRAEELLASTRDPLTLSYAHQCLGIVARDAGDAGAAEVHLRAALRAARAAGTEGREADVRATYGAALVYAGATRRGLHQLDRALAGAEGELAAKVAMRKAAVLAILGRFAEAAALLEEVVAALEGNPVWQARARIWRAHACRNLGHLDEAEREVRAADELFTATGSSWERVSVLENLADLAAARGDLARSLALGAEALDVCAASGLAPRPELIGQNARAQLAAGLAEDAARALRVRLRELALTAVDAAELSLLEATALHAAGRPQEAAEAARAALRGFRAAGRTWFSWRARLVLLRAVRGTRAEALAVATALDDEGADEAAHALTLAGTVAGPPEAAALWERAASYRRHPNALVRAAAWQARALAREETGDRGGVLRAAAAGLDAIDEHRRLIGSSELRALATTHGRELTAIALRHAAQDPRTLLRWSERTRATALAQPPATSAVTRIPAALAALRDNGRRLAQARQADEPTDALVRERLRLERAVRAESHTLSATTAARQRPPAVEEVVAAVGEGCLVELVEVDGVVHVLVVSHGTVRRRVAAPASEVTALLAPVEMLLRRASRGRPADLTGLGARLQEAVLGEAARLLPDGPVVLAPTARLHGLAWSLLPVLGERPFAVVPSAGAWLRARAAPRPRDRRTLLVGGPGLATGGAEVPLLAARHPSATLLTGSGAGLDAVLHALDGADLVHLAAHGAFRADSPLFSALELADGPLTVHDLERVRRAPYRVVLSACESGVLAPVGAEELLGLAAALFSLGTAGLVSSVAEVNDAATAELMVDLHAALAAGRDPATALHEVREHARGDAVAAGTAAAFLALGV